MTVLASIAAIKTELDTVIFDNVTGDIDAGDHNQVITDLIDTLEALLVTSFEGRVGLVTAATNDYTWAQINKATSDIADITTKSHTSLTDIGTKTHAQLDTQVGANNAKVTNVSTNLTTTQTTTTVNVVSSDGTNATLPRAIAGGAAGVLAGADQTKLDATTNTNSGNETLSSINALAITTVGTLDTGSIPVTLITGLDQNAITQEINAQTGTSYTLLDADHGKLVTLDNGSGIALTVSDGLRSDFACTVLQKGAGVVTFTEDSTTINEFDGFEDTAGQWALASISHLGSDVYVLQGRLV